MRPDHVSHCDSALGSKRKPDSGRCRPGSVSLTGRGEVRKGVGTDHPRTLSLHGEAASSPDTAAVAQAKREGKAACGCFNPERDVLSWEFRSASRSPERSPSHPRLWKGLLAGVPASPHMPGASLGRKPGKHGCLLSEQQRRASWFLANPGVAANTSSVHGYTSNPGRARFTLSLGGMNPVSASTPPRKEWVCQARQLSPGSREILSLPEGPGGWRALPG